MTKTEEKKKLDTSKGGLIWCLSQVVEFALFLALGILAIAFSDNEDFRRGIVIALGIVLIVDGGIKILINFLPVLTIAERVTYTYGLVVAGAFEVSLGIVLIMERALADYLLTTIIYFVGIAMIVSGALILLFALTFIIKKKAEPLLPVLGIILAAALIAGGIIFIVFYNNSQETMIQVIFIIVGILLILFSLFVLVKMFLAIRARHAKKKGEDGAEKLDKKKGRGKKNDIVEVNPKEEPAEQIEAKEEPKQLEKKEEKIVDVEVKDAEPKEE